MKLRDKILSLLLVASLFPLQGWAYERRDLLQHTADEKQVENVLLMNRQWVKYPSYTDCKGWNALFGDAGQAYIARGIAKLNYQWQPVRATSYLAFSKSGSREVMQKPLFDNLTTLVELLMAEMAEGEGRFIPQLVDGSIQLCEMTTWILSAHLYMQSGQRAFPDYKQQIIDLSTGYCGSILAWTHYFLHEEFDKINPAIAERLRNEVEKRVIRPYLERNDYWWQAFDATPQTMVNNWNPWCNSNVLQCLMLLENNRERLAKGIYKTMCSVDAFLNYTHGDGGCEEGAHYWAAAAGKCYNYLQCLYDITGGKISLFDHPLIKDMGEFIAMSYVGKGWTVNFADASAHINEESSLIYQYGKAVNSLPMMGLAAELNEGNLSEGDGYDLYQALCNLRVRNELKMVSTQWQSPSFVWYPETQVCYLKNKQGGMLAAKGGYNNESHNHNDVGTFIYYRHQTPIFIDAGVGTYTRQTFSTERYSIWTMQSDYHNVPVINGTSQSFGRNYRAKNVKAGKDFFCVDIAQAYPITAGVESWERTYRLKGDALLITDRYQLKERKASDIFHFLTWGQVSASPEKSTSR